MKEFRFQPLTFPQYLFAEYFATWKCLKEASKYTKITQISLHAKRVDQVVWQHYTSQAHATNSSVLKTFETDIMH